MKTQLNETIDLMRRMNLFEGYNTPRVQVGRSEMIDKIEEQDENGAGRWVSLTYVTVKPVYNTKKNWRKDDVDAALADYTRDGNEHWFDAVKSFNDDAEGKIKKLPMNKAIVVVRRYNLNWTSKASHDRAWGEYDDKMTDLRLRYGLPQKMGDNHNQREKLDGVVQVNQTGNLSKDFNFANVKSTKTTCYVINDAGHILGEFPEKLFKAMSKASTPLGPEKTAVEMLTPEDLQAYSDAKKELDAKFQNKNLLYDRILSIVASVNGVSYYYINDALKHEVGKDTGIFVNPQDMQKIGIEQLSDSFADIKNFDPNVQ